MRMPKYLMRRKATIKEYLGESGYGGPQYKAGYSQRCQIQYKRRLIRSAEGEDTVGEATLFFPYVQPVVPVLSIIEIDNQSFTVKESRSIYNLGRLSHLEVICGV
jgi:hypothetical protein